MSLKILQQTLIQNPNFDDWGVFGDIKASYHPTYPLVLLNYTQDAVYNRRWNEFESICRGLILEKGTGKVIARPFDKFFNWMEDGRVSSGHIVSISEKMDGSLGIVYQYADEWQVATRGSFNSEQALWATEYLKTHPLDFETILEDCTLLFEIIYPENRIVVNYKDREDMVLLAIRYNTTGKYMSKWELNVLNNQLGFASPKPFVFNNVTDILFSLEKLTSDEEGYVVEFSDGQYFKFKGDQYLELQRIIRGITFSHVLTQMEQGTYTDYLKLVHEELQAQVEMWHNKIQTAIEAIYTVTDVVVRDLENTALSRPEIFQYVKRNYEPYTTFVMLRLDGKDWQRDIFKYIRQHKHEIE